MALAALRDRTMLPDGSLVPWKSPAGTPMALAAAVPQWPWTDLAYSLMPNGRTLDYVADAPYRGPDGKAPIGVEKAVLRERASTGSGLALSNYAPPGTDPDADLTTWYALINAGEPYDAESRRPPTSSTRSPPTTPRTTSTTAEAPAPLLIQSGWNDDLFPADEAIRFYNRTRTQYPGDPISLFFMDDGHMRSQNKPADAAVFEVRQNAWFDHYLKGVGPAPASSAEALTTNCGGASEGPYSAADLEGPRTGRDPLRQRRDADDHAGRRRPVDLRRHSTRSPAKAPAPPPPAPTRPAPPPTACPPPRQAASRCSARRRSSPTSARPAAESELAARLLDVAPGGNRDAGRPRPPAARAKAARNWSSSSTPRATSSPRATSRSSSCCPPTRPTPRPSNLQAPDRRREPRAAPAGPRAARAGGGIVQAPAAGRPAAGLPAGDRLPGRGDPGGRRGDEHADRREGTGRPRPGAASGRRKKTPPGPPPAAPRRPCVAASTLGQASESGSWPSGPYAVPSGADDRRLRLPLTKAGSRFVAGKAQGDAARRRPSRPSSASPTPALPRRSSS